jgi:hypothetical protein
MKLHSSIRAYFDADVAAPLAAFTPDAIVADEGSRHVGHAAIDSWWRDVNAKYQAVAEPLEVNVKGDAHQVRANCDLSEQVSAVSAHRSPQSATDTAHFHLPELFARRHRSTPLGARSHARRQIGGRGTGCAAS